MACSSFIINDEEIFFVFEEGENRNYKKLFKTGKYSTKVIVLEGQVVAVPYDENGPDHDNVEVLKQGESARREGRV